MTRIYDVLVSAAVAAIVLGLAREIITERAKAQQQSVSASAGPDDVVKGHDLFVMQGCYQCHGYVGQGATATGPALVPGRLDEKGFHDYVRSPKGVMPAYSPKIISDDAVGLLIRYLRSIPEGRPPSAIPLLAPYVATRSADLPTGRQLYLAHCAACHGLRGEGGVGPDLRQEAAKRDATATLRLLLDPPPRMPKLSPTPLAAEQIQAIATYIRAIQ